MKTGIELIAEERQRQIDVEGWTPEHDDEHKHGEMALAGACYACQTYAPPLMQGGNYNPLSIVGSHWPWDWKWWKPTSDPIRNLQKAGALIAAEIDRLQRLEAVEDEG